MLGLLGDLENPRAGHRFGCTGSQKNGPASVLQVGTNDFNQSTQDRPQVSRDLGVSLSRDSASNPSENNCRMSPAGFTMILFKHIFLINRNRFCLRPIFLVQTCSNRHGLCAEEVEGAFVPGLAASSVCRRPGTRPWRGRCSSATR